MLDTLQKPKLGPSSMFKLKPIANQTLSNWSSGGQVISQSVLEKRRDSRHKTPETARLNGGGGSISIRRKRSRQQQNIP